MYAIVRTGGKEYRVEEGQSLLVERLPVDGGGKLALEPLLYVDGSTVVDEGDGLSKVKVEARVVAHERGPKLRVVKFKPKRGYKRRTGHRQELTRIQITGIKMGSRSRSASAAGEKGGGARSRSESGAAGEKGKRRRTANKEEETSTPAKGQTPGRTSGKPDGRGGARRSRKEDDSGS